MSNDPTQNTNIDPAQSSNQIGDGSELSVADPSEVLFAGRDSEGNPQAVKQRIPGRDEALRVIPPTEGYYNEFLDPVPVEDNTKVAEMLNKGFPGLDVSASDVENGLLIFGLETAVEMLKRAGGYDMYSAIEEQQEQQNASQMKTMIDAFGVGGGEDGESLSIAEFLEEMNKLDEEEMQEAASDAAGQQGMSPGPARPNGG